MKKLALFLIALCLLSSCEKDNETTDHPKKTYDIKYNGNDIVNIVLREERDLNVSSDYQLYYYSDNESAVTIEDGVIYGKNVGEANITISNSTDSIVIHVIVSLYEEPCKDFNISQDEIEKIYGAPKYIMESGDTTAYIYGSGNDWYSYAVWEMDFFFIDDQYIESDLYIRSDVELRLDEFLNNNYFYQYSDTINEQIYHIYLNEEKPENASVLLGKINNAGQYDDICIFYTQYTHNDDSYKNLIKRRNRIK